MDRSADGSQFLGKEYIAALKKHYPQFVDGDAQSTVDDLLHTGFVDEWIQKFDDIGVDSPVRFTPIDQRAWTYLQHAWLVSGGGGDVRTIGACGAYKGLINLKPAIDLVLYSNLIWELKPKTILEFGSLQGGSGLWFSDQLDTLCGHGEVHSFELCIECIHPRASHPRLHFHKADLRDLTTLDPSLFKSFPHPWLVVDDAHANLDQLVPFVAGFMNTGDYYVLEDAFLKPTVELIDKATAACNGLGFLVDTKYTDAFGRNVTCSPNGWWVKR